MCLLIGVNMVKRKLAAHDNLKITIAQDGNTFHVKESSNFRTLEIDFTLGVTFEYSLADGTELSVSRSGLKWGHIFLSLHLIMTQKLTFTRKDQMISIIVILCSHSFSCKFFF